MLLIGSDPKTHFTLGQAIATINPVAQRRAFEQFGHESKQVTTNDLVRFELIVARERSVGIPDAAVLAQQGDLGFRRQGHVDGLVHVNRPDRIVTCLNERTMALPCVRELCFRLGPLRDLIGQRE